MNSSFKSVSIPYILLSSLIIFSIGVAIIQFVFPYIPTPYLLFSRALIDFGSYFLILLIIIEQLKKHRIRFFSLFGSLQVEFTKLIGFSGMTIMKTIMGISFILFVIRIFILFPWGANLLEEMIAGLNTPTPTISIWNVLVIVLIAPVVEEILFRGVLLTKWAETFGVKKAILFSSLLFMILHIESFFIPQLVGGILYALIYIKTKQLIYPILIHSFNNLIPFLLGLFPENTDAAYAVNREGFITILNIYSIIFLITALIFVVFFIWYSKGINKEQIPYNFNRQLRHKKS